MAAGWRRVSHLRLATADGDGDGCFRSMRWRTGVAACLMPLNGTLRYITDALAGGVAGGAFGLRLLQPLAAGKVNERDLRSIDRVAAVAHATTACSVQCATDGVQPTTCIRPHAI